MSHITDFDTFAAEYPEHQGADQVLVLSLLRHAETLVLSACLAGVDEDDDDQWGAVTEACIHQAAAWLALGETQDFAGHPQAPQAMGGGVQYVPPSVLSPRAARVLRMAGLTTPVGA